MYIFLIIFFTIKNCKYQYEKMPVYCKKQRKNVIFA